MIGKHLNYNLGSSTCKDIQEVQSTQGQIGRKGTLYYNSTDESYYTYDGKDFQKFGGNSTSIPVLRGDSIVHTKGYIKPNTNNFAPRASWSDFIGEVPAAQSSSSSFIDKQGFYIEKNKFYDLGILTSDDSGQITPDQTTPVSEDYLKGGLRLYCIDENVDEMCEYMGRFNTTGDSQNFAFTIISPNDRQGNPILEKSEYLGLLPESFHDIRIIYEDNLVKDTINLSSGYIYEFSIKSGICKITKLGALSR